MLILKVVGVGMTVMHRLSIIQKRHFDSGDDDDADNEGGVGELEAWGWLLYDFAWLKIGLVQPLIFLVIAHSISGFVVFVSQLLKIRQISNLHLLSLLGLVLVLCMLRINLLGVEGYVTVVSVLSATFLLIPVIQGACQPKRMLKESGTKWACQLIAFASFLAVAFRDPDCPVETCVAFAAGLLGAMIPLVIHSIMRPKWILIGGKLKEKPSFPFLIIQSTM